MNNRLVLNTDLSVLVTQDWFLLKQPIAHMMYDLKRGNFDKAVRPSTKTNDSRYKLDT